MTSIQHKILQLKGPIYIFGASGFIGANLMETILKYRSDCFGITHNPRSAWRLKILKIPDNNIFWMKCLKLSTKTVQN